MGSQQATKDKGAWSRVFESGEAHASRDSTLFDSPLRKGLQDIAFGPSYDHPTTYDEETRRDRDEMRNKQEVGSFREVNLEDDVEEDGDGCGQDVNSGIPSSSNRSWVQVSEDDFDSVFAHQTPRRPPRLPQASSSMRSLPRGTGHGNGTDELVFDDQSAANIPDDWAAENWETVWDYEIPELDGDRRHESYGFELDHPDLAPALRSLHGMGQSLRSGNLRRVLTNHASDLAGATYHNVADLVTAGVAEASTQTTSRIWEPLVSASASASVSAAAAIPALIDGARTTVIPAVADGARTAMPESLFNNVQVQDWPGVQRLGEVMEGASPWLEMGAEYLGVPGLASFRQRRGSDEADEYTHHPVQ